MTATYHHPWHSVCNICGTSYSTLAWHTCAGSPELLLARIAALEAQVAALVAKKRKKKSGRKA